MLNTTLLFIASLGFGFLSLDHAMTGEPFSAMFTFALCFTSASLGLYKLSY